MNLAVCVFSLQIIVDFCVAYRNPMRTFSSELIKASLYFRFHNFNQSLNSHLYNVSSTCTCMCVSSDNGALGDD